MNKLFLSIFKNLIASKSVVSDHFLSKYENLSIATLQGADARKVLLFVGVMTAHSLAEGIGMGMSFGGGMTLGLFVNIAIALHNLPEGIAVSLVLVSKGVSPWFAMVSILFLLVFEYFIILSIDLGHCFRNATTFNGSPCLLVCGDIRSVLAFWSWLFCWCHGTPISLFHFPQLLTNYY